MQPPNAWLAVVHGAVMKGLAQSAPDQLTQVRVQNRRARKHYGTEWRVRYDEKAHAHLRNKKHWCGLDGCWKVYTMEWFIKKGQAVSENEPFFTSFVWTGPVAQGRIKKIKMDIYADRSARDAPLARDDNVAMVCHVEADVGHIPENLLHRRKGNDGQVSCTLLYAVCGGVLREEMIADTVGAVLQWYYELNCKIEAVCKFCP